jgi:hypothetical protein
VVLEPPEVGETVIASRKPTFSNSSTAVRVGATARTSCPASEATVNFTQCRRLASTGSASNIDRQIARVEYSFDSALLFGTEVARKLKVTPLAEVVVAIHSAVNDRDHVTLTLEARVCRNFIAGGDESPFLTFKEERVLKVTEFDVAAPVTKSFG